MYIYPDKLRFELYEKSSRLFSLCLSVFVGSIWFGMADCIERPAVEWFWHAGHHDSVYVLSDDCGTYAAMVAERKTIRNGTP